MVKKRRFLERYWEDIIQLIIIELITVYHKRDKYTDFDWVVRTIIRRKAIVWTCYYAKRDENLYFPNQNRENEGIEEKNSGIENDGKPEDILETSYSGARRAVELHEKTERERKIIEFVRDLQHKLINSSKAEFSDWDREYIEVVLELYDLNSSISRQDLIECMGYDDQTVAEFNSKLLSFRNKLHRNFGEEYKELL